MDLEHSRTTPVVIEAPASPSASRGESLVLRSPSAVEVGPRSQRERDLCERASSTDWFYLGGLVGLNVGAVLFDAKVAKHSDSVPLRMIGPGFVGLAWGGLIGGGYLALPKCDEHWLPGSPPGGDVRKSWPLALALASLAGMTAPFVVGQEQGPVPKSWPVIERSMRLVTAGLSGFAGALLPYVLPPITWRAHRELVKIRVAPVETGAGLTFSGTF